MRVFVLEPGPIFDAKNVPGCDVIYVFPHGTRRAGIWTAEYREQLLDRLLHHRFDPNTDAFVVAGHQVPIVIATNAITAAYGAWKALLWNTQSQAYTQLTLGTETRHEAGIVGSIQEGAGLPR